VIGLDRKWLVEDQNIADPKERSDDVSGAQAVERLCAGPHENCAQTVLIWRKTTDVRCGSISTETDYLGEVRFPPVSDHGADVAQAALVRPKSADSVEKVLFG
jgi:hypothetical protein